MTTQGMHNLEACKVTDQDSATAEAIGALNRKWMEAYTKRDTAFLDLHMSDDYVGTFPDGTVHDKKSEIEAVASGALAITEMTPSKMTVRVYDNAAVITGQSSVKASVGGQDMSAELRFTDVWIKRGDRWQAVSSQVTRIEQPESAPDKPKPLRGPA
jgi:ketosteroid isomerase-like protein